MLKRLRELLPEFEITKKENIYYARRERANKKPLIIPMMIAKSDDLIEVAEDLRKTWSENA